MAYTEFYCDPSTGNQMNGGSDSGSPSYTATNGGWNSGTGVFTPTSGNPSLSVTVGQFAAVFADGSTTPSFVGRVTGTSSTTVTVSVSIKIGTVPTTAGSGISIRVGGAWKGPNAADGWPVGNITNVLVNSSNNPVRVNLKNNATYSITSQLTQNQSGITLQGYSSSVGDGGMATIDGSTNAILLFSLPGGQSVIQDLIFSNNGTTGTNSGVSVNGSCCLVIRCVAHDIRGHGFQTFSQAGTQFIECEAYLCNGSGTANLAGFATSVAAAFSYCISHDNAGSTTQGFVTTGATTSIMLLDRCIADTNGGSGAKATSSASIIARNSDFYNNGGSGIDVSANNFECCYIVNCNFLKNASNGVTGASGGLCPVIVINCGFGTGTQANAATTSGQGVQEINSVNYATNVTPWIDPANGDFRINLAAAIGVGRGSFTETQASYTGARGSLVIGACQVADYPTQANVNNGTTYANGAYTGSLSGSSRAPNVGIYSGGAM